MTVTLDHRPRLLLVDDEPTNLQVLRQVLQQEYRLQFATDGQRALELAREKKEESVAEEIEKRMATYRLGLAWREWMP